MTKKRSFQATGPGKTWCYQPRGLGFPKDGRKPRGADGSAWGLRALFFAEAAREQALRGSFIDEEAT
jgi:hypothetical protein